MRIVKADGTVEEFKREKLMASLRKAGASKEEIANIVDKVERSLKDGMRTHKIYKKAFTLLREGGNATAAKYSLRRAVFGLGPTGFPFEDYLGKIFEAEGYKTKRRVMLRGKCATHEVDIAAYAPEHSFIAEAKFHMRPGVKSDLQVAMYSYARFLDLKSESICKDDDCGIVSLYIITNTKFTHTAVKYAECVGINLLSWNYPKDDSLQDKIQKHKLYPVSVLSHLSSNQKQKLLRSGIILCRDLMRSPEALKQLILTKKKRELIMNEVSELCGAK